MSDHPYTDLEGLIALDPWLRDQIIAGYSYEEVKSHNADKRTIPDDVVQQALGINDRQH